jgi:hypothetical protein
MAKLVSSSKSRQSSLVQRRGGNQAAQQGDETCHKNYFFVVLVGDVRECVIGDYFDHLMRSV